MCEEWFQNDEFIISEIHRYKAYALFLYQMADVKFIFGNFFLNFHFDKDY